MTRSWIPLHAPQGTVAHAVVQRYFEDWLKYRWRTGRRVPRYVERAFRAYLICGDPEHGFTTLACPAGHFTRHVPRRCKGRGFCAYCLTIRQRELGQRLIERVIGNVPVRHVVLCFPPHLRCVIGYDQALVTGGFTALADAMFEYQRAKAVELFGVTPERVHPGGIEVNHRVSANLGPNQHFHGIFPDGVFIEWDGGLEFCRLPPPTVEEVARIAHQACLAFCEALKARGFWEPTSTSSDTVAGTIRLPNRRACTAKFFGQAARDAEGGVAPRDGAYAFHVFVGNAIELEERPQLVQLVNYILAPPFNDGQVELDAAGNIVYRFKRDRHDGTAYTVFTPMKFLDRLADLVPQPHINSVRYYGIYAPRARLRGQAVALRWGDPEPVTRCESGVTVCPVCARKLRVIGRVTGRGRSEGTGPPDTPHSPPQRDQDRIGRNTSNGEQGRLFG